MNVADWLRTLGLGQYEAAFRENSVGMDVLPNLTADDLKDLGVNAVGDRRRILHAIAALRPGAEHVDLQNAEAPLAERRQLTVTFCDVAGSTALSTRLDPEDLSVVVRLYQSIVRSTLSRFGGFIARYVGDGVLIYFGWPETHETNAESAVRAALAVIAAVNENLIHGAAWSRQSRNAVMPRCRLLFQPVRPQSTLPRRRYRSTAGTLRRITRLDLDHHPPPAHRVASTRKPPVSGTSDLFAISVLRSNSPQSNLHPNPARPELRCRVAAKLASRK